MVVTMIMGFADDNWKRGGERRAEIARRRRRADRQGRQRQRQRSRAGISFILQLSFTPIYTIATESEIYSLSDLVLAAPAPAGPCATMDDFVWKADVVGV
ncbi:hypothetical protein Y032_0456g1781 [Ancylostoma ceylanicum]|uniref:Uncharacterized protein n=1 Tax=Ancylostoma ceylanicum TaxID=53326 RepID=A0A016WZC7_9BILA|nr:hypothetical protein Y032_0456g1781 [Ancylostoma ceylanicum]